MTNTPKGKLLANPRLVAAHQPLTTFFGQERAAFDPWWWPMNSGARLEDYGLTPELHAHLSDSLRLQPPDSRLEGCRGSIGAEPGCAMIVTTRPSNGPYPGRSGIMVQAVTNPHCSNPGPNIHVTDLVKFRGVGGDAAFDRGVDLDMWKASLDCLSAEVEALAPKVILVSKGANGAIRAWTSAFGRWRTQLTATHRQLLERLRSCQVVPSLTPRYFGGDDAARRKREPVVAEYHRLLPKF